MRILCDQQNCIFNYKGRASISQAFAYTRMCRAPELEMIKTGGYKPICNSFIDKKEEKK